MPCQSFARRFADTGTGDASLTINGSGSTTYLAGTIAMPGSSAQPTSREVGAPL